MGFRVWGLGFRVWGLGFRVWGLDFQVWDLGVRGSIQQGLRKRRVSEARETSRDAEGLHAIFFGVWFSIGFVFFFGSGTSAGVGGFAGIGLDDSGFGLCDVTSTPGCWFRGLGFRVLGV